MRFAIIAFLLVAVVASILSDWLIYRDLCFLKKKEKITNCPFSFCDTTLLLAACSFYILADTRQFHAFHRMVHIHISVGIRRKISIYHISRHIRHTGLIQT